MVDSEHKWEILAWDEQIATYQVLSQHQDVHKDLSLLESVRHYAPSYSARLSWTKNTFEEKRMLRLGKDVPMIAIFCCEAGCFEARNIFSQRLRFPACTGGRGVGIVMETEISGCCDQRISPLLPHPRR